VEGVVACQHVFGIGVYVPDLEVWGHVNVTAMGVQSVREDFVDHPPLARTFGCECWAGPQRTLRLAVI